MKKTISTIAVTLLALGLAGCGTDGVTATPPRAEVAAETQAPPPQPVAEEGSREAPFGYGFTASTYVNNEATIVWDIRVDAPFIATAEIAETNQFNVAPAAGNEYLAIPVSITWQGPDSIVPWADYENGIDVAFVTADGVTIEESFLVQPWPSLMDIADLYTGGSAQFWTVVEVPAAAAGTVRVTVGSDLNAFWGTR